MNKVIFTAIAYLIAVMPAAAALPALDFDGGAAPVAAVVGEAKAAAQADGAAVAAGQAKYRSDRDCASFSFAPQDDGVSERVWLRSTEWIEECHWAGDPRHGGGRVCREVPRWTHREAVQVRLTGRHDQYPWETEAFTVCLDGRWLSIHENHAAHKYRKESEVGGVFTLAAGAKKAMRPDPAGIRLDAPINTGRGLAATFEDRWASYYAGETTELTVKLRRQVDGWFDATLVEKTLSFPAAASYDVDFADYAGEFSTDLQLGKKYYVEWSFKRLGAVSTDKAIKVGDSATVVYRQTLQIAAR